MDFEDKKENIQPLRGGRNAAQLENAFESIESWENDRKTHEQRIENYVGDDPLQLWYDYIYWMEQTNVSSGKPAILEDAVRRCVQTFENDPRYVQDQRFIKLCIKYIDSQAYPVELYNELYNRGVGTLSADLYIAWAYYYDAADNFAKTEEVFQKGLAAGAEPKADLEQALKSFGFTMSQRLLYKDECSKQKFQSTLDDRRNALTSLRTSRKKHVGSIRTGLAVKSYLPGVVNQENVPNNGSGRNVAAGAIVYTDEPGSSGTGSSIVRPFSSVHSDSENLIESARFAKSQGKNKKSVLFPSHQAPSFDISMDEENFQLIPVLIDNYNRGIQLSARFCRSNKPQTPFEVSICVGDPKERAIPVYDKIRLYCRAHEQGKEDCLRSEYSPEELRAYRYFSRMAIENRFTEEHARVWGRGHDVGIRLHPLHVRESKAKDSDSQDDGQHNPSLGECDMGIRTKIREIYADPMDEKSVEELLMVRWQEGKIKRYVDRRFQDDIDPVDMDETHVESQRISLGGARFSIAPATALDSNSRGQMRQRRSIFPVHQAGGPIVAPIAEETEEELRNRSVARSERSIEKHARTSPVDGEPGLESDEGASRKRLPNEPLEQAVSKKEDTRPTPLKSVIGADKERTETNVSPTEVLPTVSEKIAVFVDDSDENDDREEPVFPKPMSAGASEQPYYPNDTCSTQMFNMFVKNISTPVGPIRKPESMQVPAPTGLTKRMVVFADDEDADDCRLAKPEAKQLPVRDIPSPKDCRPPSDAVNVPVSEAKANDENGVPVVDSFTPPSASCSTGNSTQSTKQLSTIMERTETSTTSSSAVAGVTKSSVDSQALSPEPNLTSMGDEMNPPIAKLAPRVHIEPARDGFFKLPLPNDEPKGFGIHVDSTETLANIPLLLKRDLPPVATAADCKENECIAMEAATVASFPATPGAARGGRFHLPEDPTITGMSGVPAGQRNLSHMPQRDLDANSIISFRMTTERTNTVPLQLVKPQFVIPEIVSDGCASIGTAAGCESTATAASTIVDGNQTEWKLGGDLKSPKQKTRSLVDLLDATFSPKVPVGATDAGVGGEKATGSGGAGGRVAMPAEDSFNLSNLIAPQSKSGFIGLTKDISALEKLSAPVASCKDLSLLPAAQVKMEKSLFLDASLELPRFTTATVPSAPSSSLAIVPSQSSEEAVRGVASAPKIVLDEFLSPFPKPAGGSERSSLDDINTAVFSLNINRAINSTVIQDGYQTPRKQPITVANNPQVKQAPCAMSAPFTITDVKGGVTTHASLLAPAAKECIDLSEVTAGPSSVQRRVSPYHADDADASIYLPRPAITQDEERWEEIDDCFDPQVNNEYQRKTVDMDCTVQHINAYISAEEVDPFDKQLQEAFLDRLNFMHYIADLPNCTLINKVQPLKKGALVEMQDGGDAFEVQRKIGKGAYGTVYCALQCSTRREVALKQERPANLWEYYICLEIRSRLTNADIFPGFMSIDYAIVGNNASIFVSTYSRYGNILDVCNAVNKVTNRNVDEFIAMIISAQILSIVDHLHSCQIIHADIKPDNFLLMSPIDVNANQPFVQLIDFGESIDMKLFENDVTFKRVVTTEGFTCVEMMERRPWTYQPDVFGVAATSHVILFGKYMQVQKNIVSWGIKSSMPRYFKKAVWENYFATLLNIRDCDHLPNLQNLRAAFLEEIAMREKYIRSKVVEFNQALTQCK